MTWLHLAFVFMAFSAIHTTCIKMAGDGITPLYAMLISNIVVFAGSIILFILFKAQGMEMVATKPAVNWMIVAGICVIIFEVAFLYIFYMNAPMATATTVMRVGTLGIVIVIGLLIFQEKFDMTKALGLVLGVTSIYLMTKK